MSDTRPQDQPDEAMLDLLIKQVTEGLSPAEQRALDVLDSEVASAYSRDLERAAAAVVLAGSSTQQALPSALAERVAQQAAAHFASPSKIGDLSVARAAAADAARTSASSERPAPRANRYGAYGWLAAAACLVLAIFAWQRSPSPPVVPVAQVTPPPVITPPPEKPAPPTPAEERAALLAKSDTLKIPLSATKDPAAAGMTGDVVWDPATQRGFLHFTGLAANDPAQHQFQIWIFDAGRDKRYPVDGGVFDVPANAAEVVIPIRAALMVRKPAAFAVTVEKPGGVVVSGREHVVALGAIS
ncbi:MAG: anti-sigma factor [Pseudomonadota bacterium]|nr:anti-sigma factor [Pseudomonadota bacterium]